MAASTWFSAAFLALRFVSEPCLAVAPWHAEPIEKAAPARVAAFEQGLPDNPWQPHGQDVRQAALGMAQALRVGHGGEHSFVHEIGECFRVPRRRHLMGERVFGCDHQADRAGNVFGATTHATFLAACELQRGHARGARQREEAGAARAVELVPGDGDRIDVEIVHLKRQLAVGLHEIDVDVRFRGRSPHEFDKLGEAT